MRRRHTGVPPAPPPATPGSSESEVYAGTEVLSGFEWLHFFIQRLFGDAWRVMTIDHVQSSSKGPFKMQFCSDHSWLMLNYVSVVLPLSCFAHVVMLFLVSNVSFVPTQKNWGNVGIFVFLVLKVHLSKSPNSRLLKNHICGSKGFLHFPQIKWK